MNSSKWNNPFIDGLLYNISSGRQVSEEVTNYMMDGHDKGKSSLTQFVEERYIPLVLQVRTTDRVI